MVSVDSRVEITATSHINLVATMFFTAFNYGYWRCHLLGGASRPVAPLYP